MVTTQIFNLFKCKTCYYTVLFIGFMYGMDSIKSVILTLAAAERVISIKEAVGQSRLEENYQVCTVATETNFY